MSIRQTKLAVKFFQTERCSEPVRQWLKNLPREEKRIIGLDIQTVQYGWPKRKKERNNLNEVFYEK